MNKYKFLFLGEKVVFIQLSIVGAKKHYMRVTYLLRLLDLSSSFPLVMIMGMHSTATQMGTRRAPT